jgi:hypothetical protein
VRVKLIGLDFGTTSSAVVAGARLTRSAVTGRVELDQVRECYRLAWALRIVPRVGARYPV